MNDKVKAQLLEAYKRLQEDGTINEAQDISGMADGELSLIVFNTEDLYNMRHDDGLMKELKRRFKFNKDQMKELEKDLADDKEEMDNEGYKPKTFGGTEESDETVDAPEEGEGEVSTEEEGGVEARMTNLEDMVKAIFTAVMDGDETTNAAPMENSPKDIEVVGEEEEEVPADDEGSEENLDDIETLKIGDAESDDLEDGEEEVEVVDLDMDDSEVDSESEPEADDDIETVDLDDDDDDDDDDDLEEGVVMALTHGNLIHPEWAKYVSTLMGDDLQNLYPDH